VLVKGGLPTSRIVLIEAVLPDPFTDFEPSNYISSRPAK
jgi:hypothetical protein